MIILDHSTYDERSIAENLGAPEYSYWFVRKAFRPLLARFGALVSVADVERETDPIHRSARANGMASVLFSFNPPQYTPIGLDCPVVPVFAWEFDTIPDESWNANPLEDWRVPLGRVAAAITHCSAAVRAVRRTMGEAYPIWSIPAPVATAAAARFGAARPVQDGTTLTVEGGLAIDLGAIDLSLFRAGRAFTDGQRAVSLLRRIVGDRDRPAQTIRLDGVVYTAVFNPADGRKNWDDMTGGFVWAFRDRPDATLVIKVTHADIVDSVFQIIEHIAKLGPFACRIVVIHGLLSEASYAALVESTSYCVNTSQGEGQCLPLMEFMAAGRPAVTPVHTAMCDYASTANAFVVPSSHRPGFWPHDERQALRCLRYEVAFDGLVRAFRESFRVARAEPARYAEMSAAAAAGLDAYCSDAVVSQRLGALLAHIGIQRTGPALAPPPPPGPDPYDMGLHDSVLSGWYNNDTGELAPGFAVAPEDVVADIGCGDGGPIRFCATREAHLILCDADGARLEATVERIREMPARRLDWHVADAAALPLPDGAATKVVCMEVLEHVEDLDIVMAELVRIGAPGARYLITVPGAKSEHIMKLVGPDSMFEPPNHVRIFEEGALGALVERAGLIVERSEGYGFFWSMLLAIFWQTGVQLGTSHPLLETWAQFWSDMLAGRDGRRIKEAFDAIVPRVQMIVARKPG